VGVKPLVREALGVLGVERFVCAVHDRCLPQRPEDDVGCGAPGSAGAEGFLEFAAGLGFTGLQLGPPGRVSPVNLSPYDGTVFSRSELQLAWRPLLDGAHGPRLLDEAPDVAVRTAADRCDYPAAFATQARVLRALHERWDALAAAGDAATKALDAEVDAFAAGSAWLEGDALYEVLFGPAPRPFGPEADLFSGAVPERDRAARLASLRAKHAAPLRRYARVQHLLHAQHARFRERAHARGLTLTGDLQVGLSLVDRWRRAALFLDGYAMGAPPSRTNPDGQPWSYPVLHPAAYGTPDAPGPALAFVAERLGKVFAEYDAVRLDHPHGLVCPWVYRTDVADPYEAVQGGARLFSVGDAPAHAALRAFDLVRAEQLAAGEKPWADDFVTRLEPEQVTRYAAAFEVVVRAAAAAGRPVEDVVCEVLSTLPRPLGAVVARYGLGRFRVTSKADVTKPDDVYLPENAEDADWVMVGTHDTPSIWSYVHGWSAEVRAARAAHAARLLAPDGVGRAALEAACAQRPETLALAELALLFVTRARRVMVFVSDLFGETAVYNRPGVVHPDNWTLRVPHDYRAQYAARCAGGRALDLPLVLALALASRPVEQRRAVRPLLESLAARAASVVPGLAERVAAAG
jgi:4-alpha-glucanotransferase